MIEQKLVKCIDVYTHQSINDRGVITNEQLLEILIEDHTGKKPSPKDSYKVGLVALWLDVQEKKSFVPKEWKIDDNSNFNQFSSGNLYTWLHTPNNMT